MQNNKLKVMHIVGARPNFVKISSILRACDKSGRIKSVLVHTGQHFSKNMSDDFFAELSIPSPDINLEVGSGTHAWQTAEIMKRFEPILLEHRPDITLVVGDVNSTIACAMVAVKLGIKVVHVEAGLRSFDRTMPEEINRVLTDSISDLLFVTEQSGVINLAKEGIKGNRVHLVGNVMIDTLDLFIGKTTKSSITERLGIHGHDYGIATMHRPSNVDAPEVFSGILDALAIIQQDMTIVFPMHPRTVQNMTSMGFMQRINDLPNFKIIEPLGYLDFVRLMEQSKLLITDSGGIQEESTVLGIPCLTVRENTERPITITHGTNHLVGTNPERILAEYRKSVNTRINSSRPELWDGCAADRIVTILIKQYL